MIDDDLNIPMPGRPLFGKLWGSHSHNTALPTSDRDYLFIYVASNDELLGLNTPTDTIDGKDPDFEGHEVGKFCRLLLKGNPSMIECLYTERSCVVMTPIWEQLTEHRDRFLSKRTVLQYLGYGQGQLRRFDSSARLHTKGGAVGEKWLYHMTRVLIDGLRIAQGQGPLVYKDGVEQRLLMDVRQGTRPTQLVISEARALIDQIEEAKPWPLPDEGDAALLNDWLLAVRKEMGT